MEFDEIIGMDKVFPAEEEKLTCPYCYEEKEREELMEFPRTYGPLLNYKICVDCVVKSAEEDMISFEDYVQTNKLKYL